MNKNATGNISKKTHLLNILNNLLHCGRSLEYLEVACLWSLAKSNTHTIEAARRDDLSLIYLYHRMHAYYLALESVQKNQSSGHQLGKLNYATPACINWLSLDHNKTLEIADKYRILLWLVRCNTYLHKLVIAHTHTSEFLLCDKLSELPVIDWSTSGRCIAVVGECLFFAAVYNTIATFESLSVLLQHSKWIDAWSFLLCSVHSYWTLQWVVLLDFFNYFC